ncbi:MAG: hypothetical protein PHU68_04535 [Paludibacter sp.]|nr:hypothetical protein [Paludibacter sp.]
MNRELIVSLLKKNIDDLILLTEGFEEMTSYPDSLIHLAQLKTNEIKQYLSELGELKYTSPIVPVAEIVDISQSEEPEETFIPKESTEAVEHELQEDLPVPDVEEDEELVAGDYQSVSEVIIEEEEEEDEIDEDENVEPEELIIEEQELPTPEIERSFAESIPEPKPITLGEKINSGNTSRFDLLTNGDPGRVNSSINNKKIDDIRQAISLGDRFRFQRELFRNNGEEMNKMLNYINLLASYTEIETFLQKKYGWAADNETAQDFYSLVKRKFI